MPRLATESGTHLANVQVRAVNIDLGVVRVEHGRVDRVRGGDLVAGVVRLDDIGRRAVLAAHAEAEGVSDLQVRAGRIDLWVDDRELVAVCPVVSAMWRRG